MWLRPNRPRCRLSHMLLRLLLPVILQRICEVLPPWNHKWTIRAIMRREGADPGRPNTRSGGQTMGAMSPMHLAVVAIVALLVFGPRKLPELAKGLGEAMKEFKKSMHAMDEPTSPTPPIPHESLPEVAATVPTSSDPVHTTPH